MLRPDHLSRRLQFAKSKKECGKPREQCSRPNDEGLVPGEGPARWTSTLLGHRLSRRVEFSKGASRTKVRPHTWPTLLGSVPVSPRALRARKSRHPQRVLNISETTLLTHPEAGISPTDTGFCWATRSAVLTCKRAQDALCEEVQLPGLRHQTVGAGAGGAQESAFLTSSQGP